MQPSAAHDWDGEKWVVDAAKVALLEQQETERLRAQVDAAADSARTFLAGDPLQAMKYAQAAVDAQAYKDAGYRKRTCPWPSPHGSLKAAQPNKRPNRF